MPSTVDPSSNRILALLPPADRAALVATMARVDLVVRQVLASPDQPLEDLYFPLGGAISLILQDRGGASVEVATVGREGMLGLPFGTATETLPTVAVVQLPGSALVMPAAAARLEYGANGPFTEAVGRSVAALLAQTMQGVLCNRLHSLRRRAGRWLLAMDDRAAGQMRITQEILAIMIGASRPKVSVVLRELAAEELIHAERGLIEVRDRAGLEALSCDCYEAVRTEYERLMGISVG